MGGGSGLGSGGRRLDRVGDDGESNGLGVVVAPCLHQEVGAFALLFTTLAGGHVRRPSAFKTRLNRAAVRDPLAEYLPGVFAVGAFIVHGSNHFAALAFSNKPGWLLLHVRLPAQDGVSISAPAASFSPTTTAISSSQGMGGAGVAGRWSFSLDPRGGLVKVAVPSVRLSSGERCPRLDLVIPKVNSGADGIVENHHPVSGLSFCRAR